MNGSITISATGGTAPYSFVLVGLYSNNNGYFTLLPAGTYQVQVTDANGQIADTTAVVANVYPIPSVSFSNVIVSSSCNSADGSFTLTGSGGTPPYTYSIDGGVTFSSINTFANLTKGVYLCLLKDANGLLASVETARGIFANSVFFNCNCCPLNADASGDGSSSCSDNTGYLDVTCEGGVPPIEYSIDGINYFPALPEGGYIFDNLGPGLYKVYAKDTTGFISVTTTDITKYCMVSIQYVSVDASCKQSDGSITIHASNGSGPYTYTMDGIHYQTDSVFTDLAAGVYNFSVKDATGAINSSSAVVFDKCPTVTAIETDESCGQKNGTITATGYKGTTPYQFSINDINFQASNVFSNLATGTYNVTIKDANGFTDSTSVVVYNNCVQLSLVTVNTTCSNKNGSIIATGANATPPYTYSIDGVNFQAANEFDSLAAGSYTIIAKDANGLTKDSTVTVTDAPAPKISVSVTNATCSNTNGSVNITTSGGTLPLQYSIDNGATFQPTNLFNSLDSGRYQILVKDSNSCIAKDTVQLTAPPNPKVFLGNDTTICDGQTFLLTTPGLLNYHYLWQDNSTSNTFLVSGPGPYSVKVTNQFNCAVSDTINIAYRSLPGFYLGNDTSLCNGKTLLLQPVPVPQGAFLWNNGSTLPSLNINSAGIYWLQVTDSGCAKKDSISITYKPNPILNLGNDTTLCTGNTVALNATNNNATYLWQNGSTQPTFPVSSPGVYLVTVNLNGCDTSGSVTINYLSKPDVSLGPDTTLCITENLLLDVTAPQSTYLWQDGSESSNYEVIQAGTYSVAVTNICGTTNASINVTYNNCACKFYVPNAFSPNGDGRNDVFKPGYECLFSNYVMKIYNRWGQLVFTSQNAGIGWDGNYKNEQAPADIYIWEIKYKDNLTGKYIRKNGTVMLLR